VEVCGGKRAFEHRGGPSGSNGNHASDDLGVKLAAMRVQGGGAAVWAERGRDVAIRGGGVPTSIEGEEMLGKRVVRAVSSKYAEASMYFAAGCRALIEVAIEIRHLKDEVSRTGVFEGRKASPWHKRNRSAENAARGGGGMDAQATVRWEGTFAFWSRHAGRLHVPSITR